MTKAIAAIFVLVGLLNAYPAIGTLSGAKLQALYGVDFAEPNLLILMRHRAVLFGLLGAFLIYAAFRPALQPLAFVAGFISMLSFVVLALNVGEYNALVKKVVIADVAGSAALLIAAVLFALSRE